MTRRTLFISLLAGLSVASSSTRTRAAEDPPSAQLRINEFVAVNASGLEDRDDDHPDWLELYHRGDALLPLNGWFLTDDPDAPQKWAFPPHASIGPRSYLVVFASGKDDNSLFSRDFHTNFSLSGQGGYIGLVSPAGRVVDAIVDYPPQTRDTASGLIEDVDGHFGILTTSTPGEANSTESAGRVAEIQFSVSRGVFAAPLTLELHTETSDAKILVSTTGATPSLFSARPYTGPFTITKTTMVRAVASKAGLNPSPVATHTYVFPEDVVEQPKIHTRITGDAAQRESLLEGLRRLDTLSIIRNKSSGTISATREDPVSIELIRADGSEGFQINAGIKRVGGASINHPKNNMRLYFSSEFGKSKLHYPLYDGHAYTNEAADEFDRLQLHGGSHDSAFYNPGQALYFRNRWMSDSHFAMGQPSLRGRWVQVYIQGVYWGFYNLTERPHPSYFAAYAGGHAHDYMATNRGLAVGSSDMKAWRDMIPTARNYAAFQRRVDVENYIDYMLLNLYAGNEDWNPKHNWMAGGPIKPGRGGFQFFSWDSDLTLRQANVNLISHPGPESLFPILKRDADFLVLLGDRIYRHFFNDGALTPAQSLARFNHRADEVALAIVGESARWGNGSWTRSTWERELRRLRENYFLDRTDRVIEQFKKAKLFKTIAIPSFSVPGGHVPFEQELWFRKSLFANAEIYYTTDGSDPRAPGGAVAPQAQLYTSPLTLTETQTIGMRSLQAFNEDLPWSPLIAAEFRVGTVAPTPHNLRISKIDYRPAKPSATEIQAGFANRSAFEFLELANTSDERIDLSNLAFVDGVQFDFAEASLTELDPGQRLLLVRQPEAFALRYGLGRPVAGAFAGGLSNGGETLTLQDHSGKTIAEVHYDDATPWPEEADGAGFYLVRREENVGPVANEAAQWRLSTADDQPGSGNDGGPAPDNTLQTWRAQHFGDDRVRGGDGEDPDGDGAVNLLEYAAGSDPRASASVPTLTVDHTATHLLYHYSERRSLTDAALELEFSRDLLHWEDGEPLETRPAGPGPNADSVLHTRVGERGNARQQYVRLRATLVSPVVP